MDLLANRSARDDAVVALAELRQRLRQEWNNDRIVKSDLKRIFSDDSWPISFLLPYEMDADIAYAVLLECLKWRAAFGVHNISLLGLKPLLDRRLAYLHGQDVKGNCILWINMSEHRVGERNVEKLIVYFLERHATEARGVPLTVFFNMSGSGLQNMDLDLVKFILHAFKYYFPSSLASVLVFENPVVLSAAWKLIRSWMDPDVQSLLQMVTRASVFSYVPRRYLPTALGGEDEFVFTMDELARCVVPPSTTTTTAMTTTTSSSSNESPPPSENGRPDLDNFAAKRTVKFEPDASLPPASVQTTARSPSLTKRNGGLPSSLKPLAESRLNAVASELFTSKFLTICPREELTLVRLDGENDLVDVVVLKNEGARTVMFKIKITSPEKFRVRPSTGVLPVGATEVVRVYLQNEYKHSISREKFLLMALETESKTSEEFASAWKAADESSRFEHKLRCRLGESATEPSVSEQLFTPVEAHIPHTESSLSQKEVMGRLTDISWRQNVLLICVVVVIVLQLFLILDQRSFYAALVSMKSSSSCPMAMPPTEPPDVDSDL